eukprot:6212096-Pleurochrysis_carterae.AAC.4
MPRPPARDQQNAHHEAEDATGHRRAIRAVVSAAQAGGAAAFQVCRQTIATKGIQLRRSTRRM